MYDSCVDLCIVASTVFTHGKVRGGLCAAVNVYSGATKFKGRTLLNRIKTIGVQQ